MIFQQIKNQFIRAIHKAIVDGNTEPLICPCCETMHKIYKRTITSGMAREIIAFYQLNGLNYAHITTIDSRGGDFSKLRYWGLIEQAPEGMFKAQGGKTHSYWRVTQKGRDFINIQITLPKYKHVLNGACVGSSGMAMNIVSALGNKFDYTTLMERK